MISPCNRYIGGFGSPRFVCKLPRGHAGLCDYDTREPHVCGPLCPIHGDPRDTSIKDPLLLGYVATPEHLSELADGTDEEFAHEKLENYE